MKVPFQGEPQGPHLTLQQPEQPPSSMSPHFLREARGSHPTLEQQPPDLIKARSHGILHAFPHCEILLATWGGGDEDRLFETWPEIPAHDRA